VRLRLAAVSVVALLHLPARAQDGYKVIVNSSNAVASLSRSQVSELFLKKVTSWPGGKSVEPVEPPDRSPAREKFCSEIHGKTPSLLKAYWTRVVFAGHMQPPVAKGSEEDVVAFVRANPGAIGYVAAATDTGGVKVVSVNP
jgi:ABC-type phosphate transport system substrate-binding protein